MLICRNECGELVLYEKLWFGFQLIIENTELTIQNMASHLKVIGAGNDIHLEYLKYSLIRKRDRMHPLNPQQTEELIYKL